MKISKSLFITSIQNLFLPLSHFIWYDLKHFCYNLLFNVRINFTDFIPYLYCLYFAFYYFNVKFISYLENNLKVIQEDTCHIYIYIQGRSLLFLTCFMDTFFHMATKIVHLILIKYAIFIKKRKKPFLH